MKPRIVILALLILILAAGTSYWLIFQQHPPTTATTTTREASTSSTQSPIQFAFLVGPPFFHVAPGEGKNITAIVQRSTGFTGVVRINILNAPNYVAYTPATIRPKASNATFTIFASKDAPKTELNLTVKASSVGTADQVALLDMKVVGVFSVKERTDSAIVYDTTKILNAASLKALSSYTNDTGIFVFSTETPQLQGLARGDVIIVPPKRTQLLKSGLMRTVLSLTHRGGGIVVQTTRASLYDELQELNIGNSGGNFSYLASEFPIFNIPTAYFPEYWYYDWHTLCCDSQFTTNGPVEIGGGDTFSATGNLGVGLYAGIHFTWSNGFDYFAIHLGFVLDEAAALTGKSGTTLDWGNNEPANLGPIFDNTIPILDDLVWITIQANWEGRASGTLNQNIDLNIHTKVSYEIGPTFDTKDDCSPCGWFMFNSLTGPTAYRNVNSVTAGTGSAAKVEIGPKLQVAINGGLDGLISGSLWGAVSADFYMQVNSIIPRRPASWWVTWGVDAYAGIGLGFSVLWGVYSWEDSLETWSLENILGPGVLFEGTTLPPVVAIIYPQPGQPMDVTAGFMAPGFKATAIDPQDGDLCTAPGVTLVWTDEEGTLGKGCSLQNELFQHAGVYHVIFTVTDAEGQTVSSQPVLVTVTVPKPRPYIVSPSSTDNNIMVGDPVDLEGGATVGVTDLSCDKITFSYYPQGGTGSSPLPTKPSYGLLCAVSVKFPSAGQWVIALTALSPDGSYVSTSIEINVLALPANPPPRVNILPPNDFSLHDYGSKITLSGQIWSRNGKNVGNYVWKANGTVVGTGDLSNSQCTPDNPCNVTIEFLASQYCTKPNSPTNVTITLTVHQGSVSESYQITLTLLCSHVA